MLDWNRDIYFENQLKEPLNKLSRKQKAQFALLCAIRVLPLISVKHFKQWEQGKIKEYLIKIFMTINLCAGHIKDMLADKNYLFLTEVPFLVDITENGAKRYVENNPNDHNANSVYAAAYVVQAVYYLSETVWTFDNSYDTDSEYIDGRVNFVVNNAISAFSTIFTGHNAYRASRFQEFIENDIYRILNNETEGYDNDYSLYNDLWQVFQNDLRRIGLSLIADDYEILFFKNYQFNETVLFGRVVDHQDVIDKINRSKS